MKYKKSGRIKNFYFYILLFFLLFLLFLFVQNVSAGTDSVQVYQDATIYSDNPDHNAGAAQYNSIWDYDGEGSHVWYTLIQFDLSYIPSDAVFNSVYCAYIHLRSITGDSLRVRGYRITEAWDENTVTWNTQPAYSESYSVTGTIGEGYETYDIDVSDDVMGFIDGTYENYGWIFINDPRDLDYMAQFDSKERTEAWKRPYLNVTYSTIIPSSITPSNVSYLVSRTTENVSVTLNKIDSGSFNITISGYPYITENVSSNVGNGTYSADISETLPYGTYIYWWVNASNATHYDNYTYYFVTIPYINAYFTYSPSDNIEVGDTVTFNDGSVGDIIAWRWYYGDGSTEYYDGIYNKTFTHQYSEPGLYKVRLVVYDGYGLNDDYIDYVEVGFNIETEGKIYIPPPEPPETTSGYDILDIYAVFNTDKLKINNNNIRVVVIDSGYTPRVYHGVDMTNVVGYMSNSYSSAIDDNGHGTFVIYELLSLLQTKCPNAEIISYKVFDGDGVADPDEFLDSLEYVKVLKPDVVSISAGTIGSPNDVYSRKIDQLRREGIVVLAGAAGNLGPSSGTILSPACSDSSIAVGAFDNKGTVDLSDDVICDWSSRGPVVGVSGKPDVAAVGESIVGPWKNSERVLSGTSMATPLVAAGSALVIAEHRGLVDLVKMFYFWDKSCIGQSFEDALKESCRKPDSYVLDGGVDAWGAGVPDFGKTSDIFYWKLIWLVLEPIALIIIIIGVCIGFWYYKKTK